MARNRELCTYPALLKLITRRSPSVSRRFPTTQAADDQYTVIVHRRVVCSLTSQFVQCKDEETLFVDGEHGESGALSVNCEHVHVVWRHTHVVHAVRQVKRTGSYDVSDVVYRQTLRWRLCDVIIMAATTRDYQLAPCSHSVATERRIDQIICLRNYTRIERPRRPAKSKGNSCLSFP